MKKTRILALAAAAAMALPLASPAQADYALDCGNGVIIFSRAGVFLPSPVTNPSDGSTITTVGHSTYDTRAVGCDEDLNGAGISADTRMLYPGATMAKMRSINETAPAGTVFGRGIVKVWAGGVQVAAYDGPYTADGLAGGALGAYGETPWIPIPPGNVAQVKADAFAPGINAGTTYKSFDYFAS